MAVFAYLAWASIHWWLAEFYVTADSAHKRVISATLDGLNTYLGNYHGEFFGGLSFNAFFVLSGWVLLRTRTGSRWLAAVGLLTVPLGWIRMFRNLTPAVARLRPQ